MDDLLTKPVDLDQLKKMLLKWVLGKQSEDFQVTLKQAGEMKDSPLNLTFLKKTITDNSLIKKMLLDFHSQVVIDINILKTKMDEGNLKEIIDMAHRIRGACQMVGANNLAHTCAEIEREGKSNNLEMARSFKNKLSNDFAQLDFYCNNLGI
jgi:HPt (histidine-containing phosphotransfer) domain-containing protein